MKNVDKLAEDYAEGKSSSDVFRRAHREDFLEGYNAAIKDLKQIVQQLQKEDITSTVYRVAYSGEENGRSLLTKEKVLEIKQKYIPYKYSAKKLSKEYNVSESCITHILNNTSWKEISTK